MDSFPLNPEATTEDSLAGGGEVLISVIDREICLRVLQLVSEDPCLIDDDERFKGLVAKIHREGKRGQRQAVRRVTKEADRAQIRATGLVRQLTRPKQQQLHLESAIEGASSVAEAAPCETTPNGSLQHPQSCYICKEAFTEVHSFYHQLCPVCAQLNWTKRSQRADLSGRTALVTGGRIKIGQQVALRLLRDGATVVVTTRFPHDAATRFHTEPDFDQWRNRLEIHALDLREIPVVEQWAAAWVERGQPLDIVIHNAAQTVKRPLAFYQHLLDAPPPATEALALVRDDLQLLASSSSLLESRAVATSALPLLGGDVDFPSQQFDRDGQQIDLRVSNSWVQKLGDVDTREMLEVFLVNTIAPFVLTSRLRPVLQASRFHKRFVVLVSAMEGQFSRPSKTPFHPHTNMAKASLNMLTRTSAAELATHGIYMNSVDTGWITDERPHSFAERIRHEQHFYPPLDIVDGAARIYDPIASGIINSSTPLHGHFLKDYFPYPW